jgi:endonuclease YncB( thermonuclease family)
MTRPLASAARLLAALAAAATLAGAAPARRGPLPFIEDNYAEALAQARAKKLPIFVEAWAPW